MAKKIEQGRQAYNRDEYETAVAAFGSARDVCRQWGDQHGEATALIDLGVTHQRMGNLAYAQLAFESALELFEEIGNDGGKATAMGNLATLYKRLGAADQTVPLLQKAADMFYELSQDDYEADTLRLLTQIQLLQGEWLDAIISYNRAVSRMTNLSISQKILQILSGFSLRVLGVGL